MGVFQVHGIKTTNKKAIMRTVDVILDRVMDLCGIDKPEIGKINTEMSNFVVKIIPKQDPNKSVFPKMSATREYIR